MVSAIGAMAWLSEAEVRTRLAGLGLDGPAIDERIEAARRRLSVMSSAPTVMERITRAGYRNADGQEIVGRTERRSSDGQRLFVVRCTVCGFEYGSYGCDADIRRCPRCQDGLPGAPIP
jgi:hypothetical protein